MATYNYPIAASADDGDESNVNVVETSDDFMTLNLLHWGAGMRFLVTLAQGTQITSATLKISFIPACSVTCYTDIYGVDANDVSAWSSGNKMSDQPKTTAFVPWDNNQTLQADSQYYSTEIDVTDIVQEILDRPGYAENALGLLIDVDSIGKSNSNAVAAYDHPSFPEPVLEIVVPTARRIFIT